MEKERKNSFSSLHALAIPSLSFFPSSDTKRYAAGPWQEAIPVQASEAEGDELLEADHENPGSSRVDFRSAEQIWFLKTLPSWNLQWLLCHGYHL